MTTQTQRSAPRRRLVRDEQDLRQPRRARRARRDPRPPGHHDRLPDPGDDHPRRPGRARRLRQGEDRVGQDPRLRAADAPAPRRGRGPAARADAARAPARARPRCPRASSPSRSTTCSSRSGAALGLRVNAVYGGADIERQVASLRKGSDLVIATPGRLIDLGDRGEVNVADLDVLVLDEADRMADMGFMPQVEWVLRRIAEQPHQTLLFSATLDGAIDRLVKRYLTDPVFHEVASDHPDGVRRWCTTSSTCTRWTASRSPQRSASPSARRSSSVAPSAAPTAWSSSSRRRACDAAAIHGDLRQSQREKALADFTGRPAAGARRDRRRGARAAHRRRRLRDALRPARGPEGVPAPLGAHRPRRVDRRRGLAAAVEPDRRGRGHP